MKRALLVVAILVGAIYIWNASWLAPAPASTELRPVAHRGIHQTFHREGLTGETCTASRIHPPTHAFIENTLPAMRAAFDAGAEIVELDVHPTTDGKLAVFHDWTLDCRTEGKGRTRDHDMAYLKSLDVGYGYTADGGKTFPLRGKGVGLMPTLDEVLAAFPDRQFIVNFKSNEAREGDMIAALLRENPAWRKAVWGAYGGDPPTLVAKAHLPELNIWTRGGLKACLMQYVALGWSGYVPAPCRTTQVMVPINIAPWLWGWPSRFQQRMADAGSQIILLGPYGAGDPGTSGIDDAATLAKVPPGFSGLIWTNHIESIGPLARGAVATK
ncbi:glycerophosphodiester phosphodiesterase family protein [Hyphomicrobium sp. CS1BSMeth3]|uniref:glycerophosphodiester phosphodiesterase family protein n=1 Tax=Hyphomicrobium sp. CS1BSMeth3 TaxID=1892844 RepID=UPI000B3199EE|nr:glycerophosphodiester phosphodiesterase family protein [Hyphomicrobium sp. CS1BSMeth3]